MRWSIPVVIVPLLCGVIAGASAQAAPPRENPDFSTCPETGPVPTYPEAPPAPGGPYVPTGTQVEIATTQINQGAYQAGSVQVGSQVFRTILDTGSSWMVINSSALAGNDEVVPTGEVAAVSYGGGMACTVGRVMRGPVSIGGLEPREMTFLAAETGNVPFFAIIGLNTWDPVSSKLDVPLAALGIDTFEFTLPVSARSTEPGRLVLNGQPTIDAASPRRVATFDNDLLEGSNRIYIPATAKAGDQSTRGVFLLDTGTPLKDVILFPRGARQLGYDYATSTWSDPDATVRVRARPPGAPTFPLRLGKKPHDLATTLIITPEQTTTPEDGILGLVGTDVVLGADYVRPWVLGVRFTDDGSQVRLLARDREPALQQGCKGLAPARIKPRGTTLIVPAGCRVNGADVTVTAKGPSDGFRLVNDRGATWIVTTSDFTRVRVTWKAPAYLTHDRLNLEKTYTR